MASDYTTKYECDNCSDEYDDEWDAGECCPSYSSPIYYCEVCDKRHWDTWDAAECCVVDEEEDLNS